MSGDTIVANTADYLGAQGGPTPPPVMPNAVTPGGASPVDALQAGIAAAGNAGVPGDNANGAKKDAQRKASATDAATKFPEGEADAAGQFQGVAAQAQAPAAQGEMAQMMPMVSGLAGAIAGAVGGILGPLTQIPQQAAQAAQGAMSPLMSAMQGAGKDGGSDDDSLDGLSDSDLAGLTGDDPSLGDGGGGGGGDVGAGGGGAGDASAGTMPTSTLGPAPVPSSPPTTPAAAAARATGIAPAASGAPAGAPMGGGMMPMMPGMAGAGAGGAGSSKSAPDEKRIAAPGVANGAPVRGRMTTPPSVPVTQSVKKDKQAPPVVTATKKIAAETTKGE